MKRKAIMCVAAALCLCSGMTAYAAPETMPDGTVFDAEYYAQMYPDVVAVLGTDRDILYNHYSSFGKSEGRLPYESNSVQTTEQLPSGIKKVSCKTPEEILVFYVRTGKYPEFMLTESRPIKEKHWLLSKEDSSKIWEAATYTYSYDTEGNYIGKDSADPYTYIYDSQGRPIHFGYEDGMWYYDLKYDEQGRIKEIVELDGFQTVKLKYDKSGLLTEMYGSHFKESSKYGYDTQERLIWITNGENQNRYDYDYDDLGRLIKITINYYGSETPLVEETEEFFYSYDEQGRMISRINISSVTDKYNKIDYLYE